MAKKQAEVVDTNVEGDAAPARGRKVILTDVESGEQTPRADYIKQRFAAGVKRGDIKKELKEKFGHDVAYQIVFAATKPAKASAEAGEAAVAE